MDHEFVQRIKKLEGKLKDLETILEAFLDRKYTFANQSPELIELLSKWQKERIGLNK